MYGNLPSFSANKVVGILWGTKADYTTWFGASAEFIHCIQMMPFTPVTEDLLEETWVQEEYPVLRDNLSADIGQVLRVAGHSCTIEGAWQAHPSLSYLPGVAGVRVYGSRCH